MSVHTNGIAISNPSPVKRKDFVFSSFIFKDNGLEAVGSPTKDEWVTCGKFIRQSSESVHFWLGDWINYGEMKWGETYRQLAEETGFDIQTLRDDKWVAGHIDVSRRRDTLSFSHHREVAISNLSKQDQEELLDRAEKEHLSTINFRKIVHEQTMHRSPEPKKELPLNKNQVSIQSEIETIMTLTNDLSIHLQDFQFTSLSREQRKQFLKPLRDLDIKISALLFSDENDNE